MRILPLTIGVAVVLALGACSLPEDSPEDRSSLACDHFRNVASDVADGVYTAPQLRQKLKEVNDSAIIGTQAVQSAARAMLRAIT